MSVEYDEARTALLVVDPFNDFLAEGGKVRPFCEGGGRGDRSAEDQ